MGSTWGNAIKISIFGESHGAGIGVVIDTGPQQAVHRAEGSRQAGDPVRHL